MQHRLGPCRAAGWAGESGIEGSGTFWDRPNGSPCWRHHARSVCQTALPILNVEKKMI